MSPTPAVTEQLISLDTNKGEVALDIDDYFSPKSKAGSLDLDKIPLLMPTAKNIEAISLHSSVKFKQMLADYDIPEAPEQITYDAEGKIQLPEDYPYGNELKQALEENPTLAQELQTVAALTSHYVALQKQLPFIDEMNNAESQEAANLIITKYSYLLNDNNTYPETALMFSEDGNMSITADGKPYMA